jgi:DNA-binding transcriptional LysR family regulator
MHVVRWLAEHVPRADIALRTSHFSSQLVALGTGLGLGVVPEPFLAPYGLAPVRLGRELAESARALPVDDMWIVGHRALRDVPRVAAVWSFLVEHLTLLAAPRRERSE